MFAKRIHMKLRQVGIGPGGWNCSCCAPAPKDRKAYCRNVKRGREREYYRRFVAESLS